MKKSAFIALFALLSAVGVQAEIDIESFLKRAARDPKNAPALTEHVAKQNPEQLLDIAAAAIARFPEQATEIVGLLVKLSPGSADKIVRVAIEAQPKLAVQITTAALAASAASEAEAIIGAALDVSPRELRVSVAALSRKAGPEQALASPSAQSTPVFPAQPSRPDVIVSPAQ